MHLELSEENKIPRLKEFKHLIEIGITGEIHRVLINSL